MGPQVTNLPGFVKARITWPTRADVVICLLPPFLPTYDAYTMVNTMRILRLLIALVILRKSNAFSPPSKHQSPSVGRAANTNLFPSEERDFYDILDISSSANHSQIKSAYRKLVKQWHPGKDSGHYRLMRPPFIFSHPNDALAITF
jgi:hypothetical protein